MAGNARPDQMVERWLAHALKLTKTELSTWCSYGRSLGVLSQLTEDQVEAILNTDAGLDRHTRVQYFLTSGQLSFFESNAERYDTAVNAILYGKFSLPINGRIGHSLVDILSFVFATHRIGQVFESRSDMPVIRLASRYSNSPEEAMQRLQKIQTPTFPTALKIQNIRDVFVTAAQHSGEYWATSLEPWKLVVNAIEKEFPDAWSCICLVCVAAGIYSRDDRGLCGENLFDDSISLCERTRFARTKSGAPVWWKQQLEIATEPHQQMIALLLFFTWAGPETLKRLLPLADELVTALDDDDWQRLFVGIRRCKLGLPTNTVSLSETDLAYGCSLRCALAVSTRLDDAGKLIVNSKVFADYLGNDVNANLFSGNVATKLFQKGKATADETAMKLKAVYCRGAHFVSLPSGRGRDLAPLSPELANEILDNVEDYPSSVVRFASDQMRRAIDSAVVPLADVADSNGWFDEE
ncbi:hypothetical protein [Fuerstiella marisgermanici]|uniref:Uncharacterized protein n=1 Tax=Fuerstiella marisgermanici TaxID=1891926 RepID=A0A1P8WG21_9PLAN|nr:hypothetical protein [Fuerstiella marisgermanici]APZ93002.1 hypothetical protein Fuma_02615 [Fuerstiella marisgermanici]